MNEIPRRSFLALLGAAVVAAKLPAAAEADITLVQGSPPCPANPVAYFRRWYVTDIETRCDSGSSLQGGVWSARVRLQQIIMTEEQAGKTPPMATIDYKDVKSASVEQMVEHFTTMDGVLFAIPMLATAEIEMDINEAMALQRKILADRIVEFAGDLPV